MLGWFEVRGWRLEVGGWRSEVGGWRLEVGGWRLEVGGWSKIVGGQAGKNSRFTIYDLRFTITGKIVDGLAGVRSGKYGVE